MSKSQDLREAHEDCVASSWQCKSCGHPAQIDSHYCMSCEMYWKDVDNGLFEFGEFDAWL